MKVAKAYEALTDDEAKRNWLEYGNPDGKQSLEVSIGLPTFLLDEANHYAILCIYLGVLVVIIPAIVAAWYQYSRKFGENNVMYETYSFFFARSVRAFDSKNATRGSCRCRRKQIPG